MCLDERPVIEQPLLEDHLILAVDNRNQHASLHPRSQVPRPLSHQTVTLDNPLIRLILGPKITKQGRFQLSNTNSRRRREGFLENYKLDEAYMVKPDRSKGRPGMYAGVAPDGNTVLIKVWPRTKGSADSDLEEIWRHELRQLHRLAGYPGAADCIAGLYDAGNDAQGFYVVLSPGIRRPLRNLLDNFPSGHWLKHPRQASNRLRVWKNLRLLARGLETLHAQGLLHRNLDSWSVLTAGGEEPDFQLTGFEWSMRIVGGGVTGAVSGRHKPQDREVPDSFLADWKMFGLLAADLLGVKRDRLFNLSVNPSDVAEHLGVEEVQLLRQLVQLTPLFPLNGEVIEKKIEYFLLILNANIASRDPKLHLVLRLGTGTSLAASIREVSQNEIEADDIEEQLLFVKSDLGESPLLIGIKLQDGGMRMILRGRNLTYSLQEYRHPKSTTTTWDFAYSDNAERRLPVASVIIEQKVLLSSAIEIIKPSEANEKYPRLRGKLTSWESCRKEFIEDSEPLNREQIVHGALSLIQLIEALYAASDVFSVEIESTEIQNASDDGEVIAVRSRRDSERDNLSNILGLKPPAFRLKELLIGDGVKPDAWILSDSKYLGDKSLNSTEWRFQELLSRSGQADAFVFSGSQACPYIRDAFLYPGDSVGRDVQFRRRLKALRALEDHLELLRMITDPRSRIIDSHEDFVEDEAYLELDSPKREALRELTSTLPLYLVQGPPGVGKTRLVRDLVRRRFEMEATSRILLTAQSNAAVDHLMDELTGLLDRNSSDGPLVVRCGTRDELEVQSEFCIKDQAERMVKKLAKSKLAAQLPPKLRTELSNLSDSKEKNLQVLGRSRSQVLRAVEGLVARAANIVFATTNSAELERLIEERGQFDWSIIEEAGKATGCELVSPMLLSHRRLMIGDHKQLPPFASDQIIEFLKYPELVKKALIEGEDLIGRSLRDPSTEEILDEIDDDKDGGQFPDLCAAAIQNLAFFETAIESEFKRQNRKSKGRPIAKKLTEQHRMHPAIASLVSRCFYDDQLTTHADCIKRFESRPRPFSSKDVALLPHSPLIVIDMPYVQSSIGLKKGDHKPRWCNDMEVNAVMKVAEVLEASPGRERNPTLAILSPYNQQVKRLDSALRDLQPKLSSLRQFDPPSHAGGFCHTVDSFQGGEADIVIVSLVRNNEHSNVQNALGFLVDARRMNVLLSRARWQLVIVASLEFLSEIISAAKGSSDQERIKFIEQMIEELKIGKEKGSVSIISFDRISRSSK